MVKAFENFEVWFITGAQLLYGGDAVAQVDGHSKIMVEGLNNSGRLPIKVVYKGTANSSKEVADLFAAANNEKKCIGVITWMHTFSPAKMWIHGLQILHKPLLHLHTQFNEEIPWRVRPHNSTHAPAPQARRGLLERGQDARPYRRMGACMRRMGRLSGHAHTAFRRPDEQRCRD